MISSPLLNGGAGLKLVKEKKGAHFNTEFNTKSFRSVEVRSNDKNNQQEMKDLRSCKNKRSSNNIM